MFVLELHQAQYLVNINNPEMTQIKIIIILVVLYFLLRSQSMKKNKKPQINKNHRVLFIIKERNVYGSLTKAYGLFNSCNFVANKLRELGIEAKVVQVVDNNCIDREVSLFKPTHCFIEAIWVVPSKFEILSQLHPNVKWHVRLHSMVPFLSSEGMAFEWINEYYDLRKKNIDISISCNNKKLFEDLKDIYLGAVSYTPNIYYPEYSSPEKEIDRKDTIIDVGCFGALRVLKNHTQQAIWAMDFAESLNKTLKFHINISEHEQREAGPILRNLRALFKNTKHTLVEHPWYSHDQFIEVVKSMDIGMQISFTETFNVTAADFVYCGVPIVVSKEIKFVNPDCRVDPSSQNQVMSALRHAFFDKKITRENKQFLEQHNEEAIDAWVEFLQNN